MLSRRNLLALAAPVFVIEAGREKEIVALFTPVPLGGEVEPGWRLMNIRAQHTYIEIELTGPDQSAFVRLDHPSTERADERTPSFAVTRGDNAKQGAGARAATRVIERLRANDHGGFWRARAEAPAGDSPIGPTAPARSRGIVIPVVVTLLVGALAVGLFVRRRRKRA